MKEVGERPISIGVLITYHNEGPMLVECIQSALNCMQPPDEILVYDDASVVPASELVGEYGPVVRAIRSEENKGPSYGRNTLMRESRSTYVRFHDADDLFVEGWCERVRAALASKTVDLLFNPVRCVDGPTKEVPPDNLKWDELVKLCVTEGMWTPSATIRRQFAVTAADFDESIRNAEDNDYYVQLAIKRPYYEVFHEDVILVQPQRQDNLSANREAALSASVYCLLKWMAVVPASVIPDLREELAILALRCFRHNRKDLYKRAWNGARSLGEVRFERETRQFARVLMRLCGIPFIETFRKIGRL